MSLNNLAVTSVRAQKEIDGATWKDCLLRRVVEVLSSTLDTKAIESTGTDAPTLVIHFDIAWDGWLVSG